MTDRELLQQALDMLDDINQCSLPPTGIPLPAEIDHVMEALRARLAQPEQEPVAWGILNTRPTEKQPLMMVMLDEPEPSHLVVPLYTAPPQREWVGLTDAEKKDIYQEATDEDWTDLEVINATEAKLKEKNAPYL